MSYQVLARKYRPQQFDDVIAQEHVTRTLKNALKSNRTSSGYLFTGPRGTGKTTTARILAKALNCVEGPTPTPCGKCASCIEIVAGSSLDVLEIDAASNTGVDDVRTLRENVRYLPTTGKKRIYIIDEVHRLSGSAFDALLKTLEEPPAHVVFIFATTEPHKVPETIRSRTQRYDFHRVAINAISRHLRKIAETEKVGITDEALYLLARKADGSVRDGMSLLDQLTAFTGENIDTEQVVDALGLIDRQFFFDYVKAVASRDTGQALDLVKKLVDSGAEIPEFASGLAEHLRILLILRKAANPEKLLELSESEMASFKEQVDYFTTGDLLRIVKAITDLILDLRTGLEHRLLLETTTLKLASMESTVKFEQILAHLEDGTKADSQNESDLFGTSKTQNSPGQAGGTTSKDITRPKAPPAATEISDSRMVNLPVVQTSWPKFIDHLKSKNQMLAALLAMAEIRKVEDNVITAVFYNAGGTSKQVVEKSNHVTVIQSELRDFFGANLQIKFETDPNKKGPEPAGKTEKIDTEKLLKEDEKLRNIVDRFDGEIIGKKKLKDNS